MAGVCRPDNVGSEISYTINDCSLYCGSRTTLFDGVINQYETQWNPGHYIDITLHQKCRIWRASNGYSSSHIFKFTIYEYQNNTWVDVTGALNELTSATTPYTWQIMIDRIPAGRYKFAIAGGSRIDTEWYLENTRRCVYLKNNSVYGMNNNIFTKLSDNCSALTDDEKKALFISTNHQTPTADELATLGKFKVLIYADSDVQQTCTVTAAPHDQLIFPKGLISLESFEGIDKVTLASTISGSGSCKLLVTTDLATYQTYDFTTKTWQSIDHTDLAAVKSTGIDAAQLGNIDRTGWDAVTGGKTGIGFAYLFAIEATTDKSAVDKLDLQVDMKGSWDKAVNGTDYKYGYPGNNLLRVQLLANGDYKINYQK